MLRRTRNPVDFSVADSSQQEFRDKWFSFLRVRSYGWIGWKGFQSTQYRLLPLQGTLFLLPYPTILRDLLFLPAASIPHHFSLRLEDTFHRFLFAQPLVKMHTTECLGDFHFQRSLSNKVHDYSGNVPIRPPPSFCTKDRASHRNVCLCEIEAYVSTGHPQWIFLLHRKDI